MVSSPSAVKSGGRMTPTSSDLQGIEMLCQLTELMRTLWESCGTLSWPLLLQRQSRKYNSALVPITKETLGLTISASILLCNRLGCWPGYTVRSLWLPIKDVPGITAFACKWAGWSQLQSLGTGDTTTSLDSGSGNHLGYGWTFDVSYS